jgi:dTDP-4-amino-4,6-dideoxygalactose transaminase
MFTPRRDALANFLKLHNIQTRPTYPEIHKTPMYAAMASYDQFPVSEYVSSHGLFLPTHTCLTDDEIYHVCRLITFYL